MVTSHDGYRNGLQIRAYTKHESRSANIRGQLDQLTQAVRHNERQLLEGRLRDADKKFYEKKVEMRCRQHVIGDLDKYYRALDWAIMQYHRYVQAHRVMQKKCPLFENCRP